MNSKKILLLVIALLLAHVISFPFGKNKINYSPLSWKKLNTVHFSFYYAEGGEDIVMMAAQIAEESYCHIADYLQHELVRTIPVVLYPSRVEFQNTNIIPEIIGETTGGFTESLKSRVVVPYTGSLAELRHILTHELVHAFQFDILFYDRLGDTRIKLIPYRIPLWIIEGMAEYLSLGYDETTDMFMRDAILNDRCSGLVGMTGYRAKTSYAYYKEGQAFYYFYEQQYGKNSIGELFRDMRDMRNFEKSLKAQTGKTLAENHDEWLRFYKRKYYHLIDKKFDNEEGLGITRHEETASSLNAYPAVSPDGERIAYLSNKDIYTTVVVVNIKYGGKMEKVLAWGNKFSRYEELVTRSNSLSWSGDGSSLCFIAQSKGRDVIYVINPANGSVRHMVSLPFQSLADPSISRDGGKIAFTGIGRKYGDIYVYSLKDKIFVRVTDDPDSDRYPKFTPDGNGIIYSSKRNDLLHSGIYNYDIYMIDLGTGKKEVVVGTPGNDIQPDISQDGKELLFSSNKTGIYNLYRMKIEDGKIDKMTDVITGTFTPRFFPDNNKIAFVNYQRLGYDIYVKDLSAAELYPDTDAIDTEHIYVSYPTVALDGSSYHFTRYESGIMPDWLVLGVAGALNYGILGYAQASMSDFLGNHRVVVTTNYFRENGYNDFNLDIAYYYLKGRWDYGFGGFRQRNPFWIFSIDDINDLIHNVNYGTESMNHYGGYVFAVYPFSRFFRFAARSSVARYEVDYSDDDIRRDVAGTVNLLSVSLVYDNVLWGLMAPADGFRGKITVDQSFGVRGDDLVYTGITADVRKYFFISREYVLALRITGGRVLGPDSEYFRFFLGGYSTLRGYDLFSFYGRNMYLVTTEFRFTLIDDLRIGWPLHLNLGDFGGVLFVDAGSAWDRGLVVYNDSEKRMEDLKFDVGCGLRFVIYPVTILKLDFAWPFDRKSFGQCEILFSLGLEF